MSAKRVICILAGLLALCAGVRAQVAVEPEVVTDSIDVFAGVRDEDAGKSSRRAMLLSLLVPGLGHHYLGRHAIAARYYAAEAMALAGFAHTSGYSRRLFAESRTWAYRYAGIEKGADDEYYWQAVGEYMDSERGSVDRQSGHNQDLRLMGMYENVYWRDDQQWSWLDEEKREEYNHLREIATGFKTASAFFIAGMVVNRAIAFVNARRITRHKHFTKSARLDAYPSVQLSSRMIGVSVDGRF